MPIKFRLMAEHHKVTCDRETCIFETKFTCTIFILEGVNDK